MILPFGLLRVRGGSMRNFTSWVWKQMQMPATIKLRPFWTMRPWFLCIHPGGNLGWARLRRLGPPQTAGCVRHLCLKITDEWYQAIFRANEKFDQTCYFHLMRRWASVTVVNSRFLKFFAVASVVNLHGWGVWFRFSVFVRRNYVRTQLPLFLKRAEAVFGAWILQVQCVKDVEAISLMLWVRAGQQYVSGHFVSSKRCEKNHWHYSLVLDVFRVTRQVRKANHLPPSVLNNENAEISSEPDGAHLLRTDDTSETAH